MLNVKSVYPVLLKGILLLSLVLNLVLTVLGQSGDKSVETYRDSAYYFSNAGKYDKALASLKRSFKKGNTEVADYYNAGCYASLTGKTDEAFILLNKSIEAGYLDKPWMEQDSDLRVLHHDKRWPALMQKFKIEEEKISTMLSKIASRNPAHVIPFQKNGLWGYLDKNDLSVIVKPIFRELGFINGCTVAYYKDQCGIRIDEKGEVVEIIYPKRDEDHNIEVFEADENQGPFPESSSDGFRGFKMNSRNEITSFSDIYNRSTPEFFNVHGPFAINSKYYIVAHKPERSGVIDEFGNALKGFEFIHKDLVWNRYANEKKWFYYVDSIGNMGFISENRELKLHGELLSYPFTSNDRFDFNIQTGNNRYGILDTQKMEWVIKPQQLNIISIAATHNRGCNSYPNDRSELLDLYFLISDKGDRYFMDRNMKVYRPK